MFLHNYFWNTFIQFIWKGSLRIHYIQLDSFLSSTVFHEILHDSSTVRIRSSLSRGLIIQSYTGQWDTEVYCGCHTIFCEAYGGTKV